MPPEPASTPAAANVVRPHFPRERSARRDRITVTFHGETTVYASPEDLALAMRQHDRIAVARLAAIEFREREVNLKLSRAREAERLTLANVHRARRLAARTLRTKAAMTGVLQVLGLCTVAGALAGVVVFAAEWLR